MSYCRWSSDDYQCDVYVYESNSGYVTEVAGRRRAFNKPMPAPIDAPLGTDEWVDQWMTRNTAMNALLDDDTAYEWVYLPEAEAGRSYLHDTPGESADNLERLRNAGLNVPQYAIDALREDAADEEPRP